MAGQVGRYAYLNAKLRARLSTMLDEEFFERVAACPTLSEAVSLFGETAYRELAELFDRTGDLKSIELALLTSQIESFNEIRSQTEDPVAKMIDSLELKLEIGVLKHALRLWFDRVVRGRSIEERMPYLYHGTISTPMEIDAVISAPNLDEIAAVLRKTPYADIVAHSSAAVESEGTLFPIEAALDRHYFHTLLQTIDLLPVQDREVARRLVGIQIDLENIGRLVRFKEAYGLRADQIASNLIPQGRRVSPQVAQSVLGADSSSARIAEIVGEEYPELSAMLSSARASAPLPARLLLIERVLEEILAIEVRRTLAGYPFTIGVVLAYFILEERELKRIRTLLHAAFYGRAGRRGNGASPASRPAGGTAEESM